MTAARDALTVFVGGEEHSGVIIYGLAGRGGRSTSAASDVALPGMTALEESVLHGDGWEVTAWDIALADWPTGNVWTQAIQKVLRAQIDAGCVVAWVRTGSTVRSIPTSPSGPSMTPPWHGFALRRVDLPMPTRFRDLVELLSVA